MRLIPLAAAALLAGLAVQLTPAVAAPTYPWCSRNAATGGDCSFSTFQQCLDYLNGVGGGCTDNPSYTGPAASRPGRTVRTRRGTAVIRPIERLTSRHRACDRGEPQGSPRCISRD